MLRQLPPRVPLARCDDNAMRYISIYRYCFDTLMPCHTFIRRRAAISFSLIRLFLICYATLLRHDAAMPRLIFMFIFVDMPFRYAIPATAMI